VVCFRSFRLPGECPLGPVSELFFGSLCAGVDLSGCWSHRACAGVVSAQHNETLSWHAPDTGPGSCAIGGPDTESVRVEGEPVTAESSGLLSNVMRGSATRGRSRM